MKLFTVLLVIIVVLLSSLWIGLGLYVTGNDFGILKNLIENSLGLPSVIKEDEMKGIVTKFGILGTVGDFFNIATSLSSVLTVALVSYGVYLQKVEIRSLKDELENGEKINRTITLIDMWSGICKSRQNEEEVERFLNNISLLYNKGYINKFDFNLIGGMISDYPAVKNKTSRIRIVQEEYDNVKKALSDAELDLKHFKERNYRRDTNNQGKRTILHDVMNSLPLMEKEQELYKKICEAEKNLNRKNSELELLKTINKIVENDY